MSAEAAELRDFLRRNLAKECAESFGVGDGPWVDRAVGNWFDDSRNYDRRWHVIGARRGNPGRVLDVAAGCGTFMLYGLRAGYDVTGIEPEPWKREFYTRKIALNGDCGSFTRRMVAAVGEQLPFADESFDLVTTFQTLEHVADVDACLAEMVRVLRPGGVLYARAPDYNCLFEPHYRLPLVANLSRCSAERFLRWCNRPVAGLRTLNWTTERGTVAALRRLPWELGIERTRDFFIERRRREIHGRLPAWLGAIGAARVLNEAHQLRRQVVSWLGAFRQERVIDLWITKRSGIKEGRRCAA